MADDALTAAVAEALAAHARTRAPDGLPTPNLYCACGWSHPDRFIANPDLHRAHIAERVAQVVREHTAAKQAEAWDEGYRASDHEAYHFSTHGRTDNPYRAEGLDAEPAPDADAAAHTREQVIGGPDVCRECSAAVQEYVVWPCSPTEVARLAQQTAHRYCGSEGGPCEAPEGVPRCDVALARIRALAGLNGEGVAHFRPEVREGYLLAIEEVCAALADPDQADGEDRA